MKKILSIMFVVLITVSMPFSAFAQNMTNFKLTKDDTKVVQQSFEKTYTNKIVVIPTWELSDQGKSVKVTSKADLADFDKTNLVFYDYNKIDNKLKKITTPADSIDTKGVLTFTTSSNQGFVIISNSVLTKATSTTATQPKPKSPSNTPSSDNAVMVGNTVYITPTGKKYHYANPCGKGNYSPSTLEKAKAKGLSPCEKCVLK